MAYTNKFGQTDGTQKFGFDVGKITGDLIVESYTETTGASRVDLDDGNGKPIGSATVPSRVEVSLTVQYGEANAPLDVADTLTYDGNTIGITSVEVIEAQSDYVRMSISGFVLTTGSLVSMTDIG